MTQSTSPARAESRALAAFPGRWVVLACVVLGPLLVATSLAGHDFGVVGADGAPDLAAINGNYERMELTVALGGVGTTLLLGVILGLGYAARRSPRVAVTGVALGLAAVPSMVVNSVSDLPYLAMHDLAASEVLDTVGSRYLTLTESQPAYLLYFLYPIAIVILAAGLFRAGSGPRWAAVCVACGALLPIGPITGIGGLSFIPAALLVLGGLTQILAERRQPAPEGPAVQ